MDEAQNLFSIETLVYIAGVLTPHNSINIQSAFNSLPTATVSLPPYPQLYGMGRQDRLPIHIFIKDTFTGTNDYVLLFEGEVKSFSYVSNAISREIVVNAQNPMAFLMDVNAFFMHNLSDMAELNMIPEEREQGYFRLETDMLFPHSLFMRGLTPLDEDNSIQVPGDFLENVYKFFEEPNSMGAYNNSELANFYGKYTETLKLQKRMVRVPVFDDPDEWDNLFPVLEGIQKNNALKIMMGNAQNAISGGKTGDTFYNWLNFLVSEMQYELCFINSPVLADGADKLAISMMKPMLYESDPPACNIIFRSLVESIRAKETVYQVPTRVRTDDHQHRMTYAAGDAQVENAIARLPRINWWPRHKEDQEVFSEDILPCQKDKDTFPPCEDYTGPYLFDTHPPTWASYLDYEHTEEDDVNTYYDRILQYLLRLKIFESRNLEVSMGFNPFIVAGFPGVVFDTHDETFTFAGHVIAVNHSISKQQTRTTVSLGFTRILDEAINDPIKNPFDEVDEITRDLRSGGDDEESDMNKVYRTTIGSQKVDYSDVKDSIEHENDNPKKAYEYNFRPIVTLDEYLSFMGLSVEEEMDTEFGEQIPLVISGDYVEKRRDTRAPDEIEPRFSNPYTMSWTQDEETQEFVLESDYSGIRAILREIAERAFINKIY